jgi:hypothetical protein
MAYIASEECSPWYSISLHMPVNVEMVESTESPEEAMAVRQNQGPGYTAANPACALPHVETRYRISSYQEGCLDARGNATLQDMPVSVVAGEWLPEIGLDSPVRILPRDAPS